MVLKLDLHVHSKQSKDAYEELERIFLRAKKLGLDGIAITDHDSIASHKEAEKIAKQLDMIFIPGLEVSSKDGDIVALGIKELIPKKLSAKETIELIHKQNAIAIAAHPYGRLYHRNSVGDLANILPFDAVEGINARGYISNVRAEKINKPKVGGSDAHIIPEIGRAHTEIDSKKDVKEILEAIKQGKTKPVGESIRKRNVMKYAAKRTPSLVIEKLSNTFVRK